VLSRLRDGLLAILGALAAATLAVTTGGLAAVLQARAVGVGVAGAILLETLFLRYPDRLLPVWERPGVPTASLLAVVAAGLVAARHSPWLLGALLWGLSVYLALLSSVLAGFENPLSVLAGQRSGSQPAEDRE
jgi:hypothetical protein